MICPFLTSFPYHMLMEWNEKQGERAWCVPPQESVLCVVIWNLGECKEGGVLGPMNVIRGVTWVRIP